MCVQHKAIHLAALHGTSACCPPGDLHSAHEDVAALPLQPVLLGSSNGQPKEEDLQASCCRQHVQRVGSAASDMHEVI